MNKFNLVSVSLFAISLFVFCIWFFNEEALNDTLVMVTSIGFPIIGLLIALKGKGALKIVGVIGNTLILVVSIIIPAISLLFWNQP